MMEGSISGNTGNFSAREREFNPPPISRHQIIDTSMINSVRTSGLDDWEMLARELGLSEDSINEIQGNSSKDGVSEMCCEAIHIWKQQEADKATVRRLAYHLLKRGCPELSLKIKQQATVFHCGENLSPLSGMKGANIKSTRTDKSEQTSLVEKGYMDGRSVMLVIEASKSPVQATAKTGENVKSALQVHSVISEPLSHSCDTLKKNKLQGINNTPFAEDSKTGENIEPAQEPERISVDWSSDLRNRSQLDSNNPPIDAPSEIVENVKLARKQDNVTSKQLHLKEEASKKTQLDINSSFFEAPSGADESIRSNSEQDNEACHLSKTSREAELYVNIPSTEMLAEPEESVESNHALSSETSQLSNAVRKEAQLDVPNLSTETPAKPNEIVKPNPELCCEASKLPSISERKDEPDVNNSLTSTLATSEECAESDSRLDSEASQLSSSLQQRNDLDINNPPIKTLAKPEESIKSVRELSSVASHLSSTSENNSLTGTSATSQESIESDSELDSEASKLLNTSQKDHLSVSNLPIEILANPEESIKSNVELGIEASCLSSTAEVSAMLEVNNSLINTLASSEESIQTDSELGSEASQLSSSLQEKTDLDVNNSRIEILAKPKVSIKSVPELGSDASDFSITSDEKTEPNINNSFSAIPATSKESIENDYELKTGVSQMSNTSQKKAQLDVNNPPTQQSAKPEESIKCNHEVDKESTQWPSISKKVNQLDLDSRTNEALPMKEESIKNNPELESAISKQINQRTNTANDKAEANLRNPPLGKIPIIATLWYKCLANPYIKVLFSILYGYIMWEILDKIVVLAKNTVNCSFTDSPAQTAFVGYIQVTSAIVKIFLVYVGGGLCFNLIGSLRIRVDVLAKLVFCWCLGVPLMAFWMFLMFCSGAVLCGILDWIDIKLNENGNKPWYLWVARFAFMNMLLVVCHWILLHVILDFLDKLVNETKGNLSIHTMQKIAVHWCKLAAKSTIYILLVSVLFISCL